jgi:hypothetical protein
MTIGRELDDWLQAECELEGGVLLRAGASELGSDSATSVDKEQVTRHQEET